MNIVFRVDASLMIGSGHVMRCLALAECLRVQGHCCLFLCRDHLGNRIDLIRTRSFDVVPLSNSDYEPERAPNHSHDLKHSSWLHVSWEMDVTQVHNVLEGKEVDWLVVDHYGLDVRWESEARSLCKRILVIDDLADRDHDCDVLVDQNYQQTNTRYVGRTPSVCAHLIGPKYALLGAEYRDLHSQVKLRAGKVNRVLVYFGGADVNDITSLVLRALRTHHLDPIQVNVVVDSKQPNSKSVQKLVSGEPNFTLHMDIPTLSDLMMEADLAIGAAGVTSWERCCLGLPTLVISLAENQKLVAQELHTGKYISWLGHVDQLSVAEISQQISRFLVSGIAETWSRRCWELVDGRGVERLAFILSAGPESRLEARLATWEDEGILLDWANDPVVRRHAFDQSLITAEEHVDWLGELFANSETKKLFIVQSAIGVPVGQARFEKQGIGWEISYALDGKFRSRGLGAKFLSSAISSMRENLGRVQLFGRVKTGNVASIKVFEKLGFQRVVEGESQITFMRDI